MAEIMSYTPTAGLTDRTSAGFYAAYKSLFESTIMPQIDDIFTCEYEDDTFTIHLTPVDPLLSVFKFLIGTSQCTVLNAYYAAKNNSYRQHSNYATDPVLHFYRNCNDVFFGLDNSVFYCGLFRGKRFDGTERAVIVGDNYYCVEGSENTDRVTNPFNRVADGKTSYYRIQSMPVPKTDIVLDNVYYLDGGMSLPPAGVFKIGNDSYCTLHQNVVVKL